MKNVFNLFVSWLPVGDCWNETECINSLANRVFYHVKSCFFSVKPSQEALHYDQVLAGDKPKYTLNGFSIVGKIEHKIAETVWNLLAKHIDALRLKVEVVNEKPRQYIRESVEYSLPFIDFSHEQDPRGALMQWAESQSDIFIRYEDETLIRPALVKLSDTLYALHMINHHIIGDGIGLYRLHEYFHRLYQGYVKGSDQGWLQANHKVFNFL